MSTPWTRFNQPGAEKTSIRVLLPVSYKIYHDPIPPNSNFFDSVDYGTRLVTLDAESSLLPSTMTIDVEVVVIEIVVIVERRAEVRPRQDVKRMSSSDYLASLSSTVLIASSAAVTRKGK